MASVSSLYSVWHSRRVGFFTAFSNENRVHICRRQRVLCRKSHEQEQQQEPSFQIQKQEQCGARRRQVTFQMAFTAFSFGQIFSEALAENDELRTYTDDMNKFKITIPQDWQIGAGEPNGFKSVTAFYPEGNSSSNVSVAITGLGPDFTRMESFGKVDAFAETLVSGLDRSWQRPPGVAAKLIDCKSSNGFYYIEYTLQLPSESRRHLFSAIGMASNGWYNRLYTVTGQFMEEDTAKYGPQIEKVHLTEVVTSGNFATYMAYTAMIVLCIFNNFYSSEARPPK